MVLLVLIAAVGYAVGSTDRVTPWYNTQYETDGMFLAAAVVFFGSVGFDAVANAAEEVRAGGPARRGAGVLAGWLRASAVWIGCC